MASASSSSSTVSQSEAMMKEIMDSGTTTVEVSNDRVNSTMASASSYEAIIQAKKKELKQLKAAQKKAAEAEAEAETKRIFDTYGFKVDEMCSDEMGEMGPCEHTVHFKDGVVETWSSHSIRKFLYLKHSLNVPLHFEESDNEEETYEVSSVSCER